MIVIRHNVDTLDRAVPQWLDVEVADLKATVRDLPLREQIDIPCASSSSSSSTPSNP